MALRRRLVLATVNHFGAMYCRLDEQQAAIQRLKQFCYQNEWLQGQLLQHVSPEVADNVWVELNVNQLDPDFSFEKWVKENQIEIEARLRARGQD